MVGRWTEVNPRDLLRNPARYSFSWPGSRGEGELRESVGRFGVLRPPLCLGTDAVPTLVAGHRRLEAAAELGRSVPIRWVEAGSGQDLWDLLLEEHVVGRPLNPVEIGLYAHRRIQDTGESVEDLSHRVGGRWGLPTKAAGLQDYLWLAELPHRHRDAFATGRLPAQGVRVLVRAPREDALAVLDLLAESSVGVNKFSEIARWVLECAWARGEGATRWIQTAGLSRWSRQPERLRRELRRLRFPTLGEWEASFPGDAREAGLPSHVRLAHSRGFEGGRLTCTVTFASLDELALGARELLAAVEKGRLGRLARYLG